MADINVWLALVYGQHGHHEAVLAWFGGLNRQQAFMCRLTQIGLLRLLTNLRVMGRDVLSQKAAWKVLDRMMADDRVGFLPEPPGVEQHWRRLTQSSRSSTNTWPDAYLAAVASAAGLTVATLDQGFSRWTDVRVAYVPA